MANVLNLTLKKDVFESIVYGDNNIITIDNSKWWKKRLMDLDTGKFKEWDIVRLSSGSADKFDYPILNMEFTGMYFKITVLNQTEDEGESEDVAEQEDVQPEIVDDSSYASNENVIVDVHLNADVESVVTNTPFFKPELAEKISEESKKTLDKYEQKMGTKISSTPDYKKIITQLLNSFCENKDVYSISTPGVTVLPNGRILGSKKTLVLNKYTETRIPLHTESLIKYNYLSDEMFIKSVKDKLDEIIKGNIVFIRKAACGFTKIGSGEDCFVITFTSIKKYHLKLR